MYIFEHPLDRIGWSRTHGDVGLDQVVILGGAIERIEAVSIDEVGRDLATQRAPECGVVRLINSDLVSAGRKHDQPSGVVDLEPDDPSVAHQVRNRRRQRVGQCGVLRFDAGECRRRIQVRTQGAVHLTQRSLAVGDVVLLRQVDNGVHRDQAVGNDEQDQPDQKRDQAQDRVIPQEPLHVSTRRAFAYSATIRSKAAAENGSAALARIPARRPRVTPRWRLVAWRRQRWIEWPNGLAPTRVRVRFRDGFGCRRTMLRSDGREAQSPIAARTGVDYDQDGKQPAMDMGSSPQLRGAIAAL